MKLPAPDFLRKFKFEYKITLTYLIFGFLWILFSDKVLDSLESDVSLLTKFQTFKGSFFILVTSGFLFLFVKRHMQNLRSAESQRIQSENHYKALFNDNLSVILLINPDNGKIEDANQAACKYYGWTHTELCKKSIYDLNTLNPEQFNTVLESLVSETQNRFEFQHRLANGVVRDAEVFTGPIRIGNKTMVYSHIKDITEQKLADEKIRKKDSEFRKLSANVPDMIYQFTKKPDGTYSVPIASEGIRNIFGCAPEDVVSDFTPIARVIHPEDIERVFGEIEYSAAHMIDFNCEYRVQIPGKKIQWLYCKSTPEKQSDGSIAWYGFNADITQKKLAEETLKLSEERYRSLFENMNAGFVLFEVIHDNSGLPVDLLVIAANEGFEKTTGVKLEDSLGKLLTQVVPGIEKDNADWIGTYSKVAVTGESIQFEQFSELLGVYYSISAFQPGPNQCAVTFIDISDRRRVEEQINKLNVELENRIVERTNQLLDSNKELESFAFSVSHDLRAPLRHVIGFSEMLEYELKDRTDPEIARLTGKIKSSASKMSRLIDELLTYSRHGRTDLKASRISLNTIINDIINEAADITRGRNIEWKINQFPVVTADPVLIKLVLQNLILNSIKFTSKKENAQIEINFEEKNEKGYTFYIKDNGAGFNMQYANKLFGVFQRLHSSEEFEGTGIGLATVRRIINRHNGSVWAEGYENEGATFFFTLPE